MYREFGGFYAIFIKYISKAAGRATVKTELLKTMLQSTEGATICAEEPHMGTELKTCCRHRRDEKYTVLPSKT